MGHDSPLSLAKTPTGIDGFDPIVAGGLPRGRTSLIAGAAGSGKTLFGMEFLIHGALTYGEPGLFVAFEENAIDLHQNVASLGFDLPTLEAQGLLLIDSIKIDRHEIEEVGEYDLEGLFIRLGFLIDRIGAKRIVLDTLEVLFAVFPNQTIVRAELSRLFQWLKERGMTTIATAERGDGGLTRHGIEEYVADCVILLDHRIVNQISTRRLRVIKYRGSTHGTNEYPFIISEHGLAMLPITTLGLEHQVSDQRISTGIPQLDQMFGGPGLYRGTSILVSGAAGTGKTSLSMAFVNAACGRGERALVFSFEESPAQLMRNMRSIGIDLRPWTEANLLRFMNVRPTQYGLELHLMTMIDEVRHFKPQVIVIDPITTFGPIGGLADITAMLARLLDSFKASQITTLCTSLTGAESNPEQSEVGISSLVDVWILLRNIETNGERNRGLFVLKARGIAHSNQIRELIISDEGLSLTMVYTENGTVLTGTARLAAEANQQAEQLRKRHELELRQHELARQRLTLSTQIASLQAELAAQEVAAQQLAQQVAFEEQVKQATRESLQRHRLGEAIHAYPREDDKGE